MNLFSSGYKQLSSSFYYPVWGLRILDVPFILFLFLLLSLCIIIQIIYHLIIVIVRERKRVFVFSMFVACDRLCKQPIPVWAAAYGNHLQLVSIYE